MEHSSVCVCACVWVGAASVQLLLFKPHLSLHSISYCSYGGVSRILDFLNGTGTGGWRGNQTWTGRQGGGLQIKFITKINSWNTRFSHEVIQLITVFPVLLTVINYVCSGSCRFNTTFLCFKHKSWCWYKETKKRTTKRCHLHRLRHINADIYRKSEVVLT